MPALASNLLSDRYGRAPAVAGRADVNPIRRGRGFVQVRQSEHNDNGHYNGVRADFRVRRTT